MPTSFLKYSKNLPIFVWKYKKNIPFDSRNSELSTFFLKYSKNLPIFSGKIRKIWDIYRKWMISTAIWARKKIAIVKIFTFLVYVGEPGTRLEENGACFSAHSQSPSKLAHPWLNIRKGTQMRSVNMATMSASIRWRWNTKIVHFGPALGVSLKNKTFCNWFRLLSNFCGFLHLTRRDLLFRYLKIILFSSVSFPYHLKNCKK